ncbi:helix-turn-helix domain-containing protein [Megamonas funiformis]|uniref:helix-turn-helix domain-containing protein n=1 Tax=Megamonas funiformis TaxID=437897 RepID=UPI0022E25568|nr:helix-turn-helix transcriptional regulator [Megamonas funiformis]
MEIFERVKYFRKNILHLSQKEFAKKLNISGSNLSNIEIGRINLTDRVINEICDVYNINKEWLCTGEGEIEKTLSRDEEIFNFFNKIKDTDNILAKRFILALSKLDIQDWEVLDKLINNYLEASKSEIDIDITPKRTKPDHKLTPAEKRRIVNSEINQEEKVQIL